MFLWSLDQTNNNVRNWSKRCKCLFLHLKLDYLCDHTSYFHVRNVVNDLSECLHIENVNKWHLELARESAHRGQGKNKLRTYRQFKTEYKTEQYVSKPMAVRHRRALALFRCGVAPIRIETGRYERNRLTPEQRVCFLCTDFIEDEAHVILDCPLYEDLRENLIQTATDANPNFKDFSASSKLGFILGDPIIYNVTARILHLILERRKLLVFK